MIGGHDAVESTIALRVPSITAVRVLRLLIRFVVCCQVAASGRTGSNGTGSVPITTLSTSALLQLRIMYCFPPSPCTGRGAGLGFLSRVGLRSNF